MDNEFFRTQFPDGVTDECDIIVNINQSIDYQLHAHNHLEISICTEGTVGLICNNEKQALNYGQAMIAFPNETHGFFKHKTGSQITMIMNIDIFPHFSNLFSKYKFENFYLKSNPDLVAYANGIVKEIKTDNNPYVKIGYAYLILSTILKSLNKIEYKYDVSSKTFSDILNYISKNFGQTITLKMLSEKHGISYSYLSKMFTEKLSCTFIQYLHTVRIEHAKALLVATKKTMSEIAFESGFSDIRTFNRVFKQIVSSSPSEYRITNKSIL